MISIKISVDNFVAVIHFIIIKFITNTLNLPHHLFWWCVKFRSLSWTCIFVTRLIKRYFSSTTQHSDVYNMTSRRSSYLKYPYMFHTFCVLCPFPCILRFLQTIWHVKCFQLYEEHKFDRSSLFRCPLVISLSVHLSTGTLNQINVKVISNLFFSFRL